VVDDGKGYGGGKRFVLDEEYESDKSIVIQPPEEDFQTLHFYYNYSSHVAQEAAVSPLLFEVLEMFKQPNEAQSVKGLVIKAMAEQIDCKVSFWVPLFIAVVFSGVSLGVLSLILSMNLLDLMFDKTK
jgi:hypothetical protein